MKSFLAYAAVVAIVAGMIAAGAVLLLPRPHLWLFVLVWAWLTILAFLGYPSGGLPDEDADGDYYH